MELKDRIANRFAALVKTEMRARDIYFDVVTARFSDAPEAKDRWGNILVTAVKDGSYIFFKPVAWPTTAASLIDEAVNIGLFAEFKRFAAETH